MTPSVLRIALYGAGKMGMAMVGGWLAQGYQAENIAIIDPNPSKSTKSNGFLLNPAMPDADVVVLAVKPQVMDTLLSQSHLPDGALVISVAAGLSLDFYAARLGEGRPIIRAMPNTPAAIGMAMTAIIGNNAATPAHIDLAEQLLGAIGVVARLENEAQMDVVTGLSGSGPAYVFHMIEAMRAAGINAGLPAKLAHQLALQTVAGAGAYAQQSGIDPAILRENVTSPGGTTAAGLAVLMGNDALGNLVRDTVAAATARSKELNQQ